ncbi:MAG: 6-phosphogluconolactonase, partial [Desulfobulbaceae bacterium]|nr:6-phosphogluconolactonase [Desulfobulbaceae bacterium]
MKAQRHDFEDIDQCCRQLAARLVATARECVAARGRFTLALAGGSTPKGLYQLLAQPPFAREMPWQRTHFFWGDERCVPADHPDSNFGMARDAMLAMVPASLCHVHRMDGDLDPATAAGAYEGVLRSFFKLKKDQESTPRFPSFDT